MNPRKTIQGASTHPGPKREPSPKPVSRKARALAVAKISMARPVGRRRGRSTRIKHIAFAKTSAWPAAVQVSCQKQP